MALDDAEDIRTRMRRALPAAMRARDKQAVTALRSALAAIDNAEAVAAPQPPLRAAPGSQAGAEESPLGAGPGSGTGAKESPIARAVVGPGPARSSAGR